MTTYFDLANDACQAVAALLPGATTQDDGAGEYIRLDDAEGLARPATLNGVLLFVINPAETHTPEDGWHWQYQHVDAEPMICETSRDLTITSDPKDVAAWARTLMAQPAPTPTAVANFRPSVALVRRPDGGWAMEVDWADSFTGYSETTDDAITEFDPDSMPARVACAAMDAWARKQPPTILVPDVATYHGIVQAECRACGHVETDVTELEMWNDYGVPCLHCNAKDGETVWTTLSAGGTTEVRTLTFKDGELVDPVDFDTAEAAGLDGTGRDGNPRFPFTVDDVTL